MKPYAEKMITLGKRGDLHARRLAMAELRSNDVVHKLFCSAVAPRFTEREGGYTRIVKLGPRQGDAAPDGAARVRGLRPRRRLASVERYRRSPREAPSEAPLAVSYDFGVITIVALILAFFFLPAPWERRGRRGSTRHVTSPFECRRSSSAWSRRRRRLQRSTVEAEALIGRAARRLTKR